MINLENVSDSVQFATHEKPETTASFGSFTLDRKNALLSRDQQPVALTPKAFSLLCYLMDNAEKLVTKDEIFASVWPKVVVGDAALTVCIREIRKALGESSQNPHFIETVHKRGYRFSVKSSVSLKEVKPEYSPGLVGRKNPLHVLDQCFEKIITGNRKLIFVTGEAGIGKTTLIETFIHNIPHKHNTRIASGQCIEQYGVGEAYLPVLDALGRLCRTQDHVFLDLLAQSIPSWLPHLPGLCNAVNKDESRLFVASSSPEKMLREMAEALETISQVRPLILYLEDLQWADYATIDLLSFLARRKDSAQLMIIGSFRPADVIITQHPLRNLKQDLQLRGCCTHLPLEYLNQLEIAHHLAEVFPQHGFPEQFPQYLQQHTNGNPLFLVNILEDLKSSGFLAKQGHRWQLEGNLTELANYVPDDIQAMITQQIEKLPAESQQLLEAASVASEPGGIAIQFNLAETASTLDINEVTIEAQFEELAAHCHFLRGLGVSEIPNGCVSSLYEFTHTLYQNVLYQRVSVTKKVHFHRRLGQKLEQSYGEHSLEIATKLAVHFELGRDFSKALRYISHSAKIASHRGADREAVFTLNKARHLLEKIPQPKERNQLELSLLQQLGPALTASQGNASEEIEECYLRAKDLCQVLQDEQQLFTVLFGLRSFYLIKGDFKQSHELALKLLELAERLKCEGLLLEAHVGLTNSFFFAGNLQSSYEHALAGIALYDPKEFGDHASLFGLDPGVLCYARAGQTIWALGSPDTSLNYVQQAVKIAETLNHPYSYSFALHNLALIHLYRREGEKALNYILSSLKLAKTHGFKFLLYWGAFLKTWSLSLTEEATTAKTEINKRLTELQSKTSITNSYLAVFLAEACWHMQDFEKGQAALEISKMENIYDAERLRLEGEFVLAQESQKNKSDGHAGRKQAENLFRKALEISQKQGAKFFALRAAVSLSQLLINSDRNNKVQAVLHEIYHAFNEGLDTEDLKLAKQTLDQFSN